MSAFFIKVFSTVIQHSKYLPDFRQAIQAIATLTALTFVLQLWISYWLWLPDARQFPVIPIFETLPLQVGATMQFLLFWLFQICLLLTAFSNFKKISLPLLFGIFAFWLLQDAMRLQAWTFHYIIILALVYLAILWPKRQAYVLWLLRFLMITTYIWTGFHKLNLHFADSVFPWLMGIFNMTDPLGEIPALAYGSAIFEALLGIGLIWKKGRKLALWALTFFHFGILVLLIADGWNYVVYSWNIAMVGLLWILFYKAADISYPKPTELSKWLPSYIIVFLFGVAPGLQPFGLWPHDMSLMMYTGLSEDMRIYFPLKNPMDKKIWSCIPKGSINDIHKEKDSTYSLNADTWTMKQMNVPTYPAEWYYRRVAKKLCTCLPEGSFIEVEKKKRWDLKDEIVRIPCKDF